MRVNILRILGVGLTSTAAMTLVMEQLYNTLPHNEQYPLPPEEIATVAEVKVLGKSLNRSQHMTFTWISHFGYGLTLTGLYSLLVRQLPFPPLVSGISYGLVVWAGSYLGWLPAFHVLPPATKFPPARRSLMIISHVVWGALLGTLMREG